jgi:hypothetical protein
VVPGNGGSSGGSGGGSTGGPSTPATGPAPAPPGIFGVLGPILGQAARVVSAPNGLTIVPGSTASDPAATTATPRVPTIKSAAEATRAATLGIAAAAATDLSGVTRTGSHDSSLPSVARVALIFVVAMALLVVLLSPRLPFLQGPEDEFELAGKNPLLQRLRRRQRGVVIAPGGGSNFNRAPNP